MNDFPTGAVLVSRYSPPVLARVIPRASAVITDVGSPISHMATVAREFRVPTIVDAGLATGDDFRRAMIGEFDVDLFHEFFQGFVNHARVTLHIDCLRGDNAHHVAETIFKAFGRAMRMALEVDTAMGDRMPSTKGSL